MSGYFVHGGTQYPYGQSPQSQQGNAGNSASPSNNSFFANNSFSGHQSSNDSFSQQSNNTNYFNQTSTIGSTGFSTPFTSSYNNADSSNTGFANNNRNSSMSNFGGGSNNNNFGNQGSHSMHSGGGGFSGGSGYGGPKNSNYGYNFSGSKTSYGGPYSGGGSFDQFQHTQSSYEKALYNAANQYYGNKRGRGRGAGGGGGGRGRGSTGGAGRGGGFGVQGSTAGKTTFQQNTGPKAIKATEIKAYLYAWCGQRKLKPEYEITPKGQPPHVLFSCRLHISGLDYVAEVDAQSKRDSQTKAAWDFCENLVKVGYMKASELPPKPMEPTPKSQIASVTSTGETQPESEEQIEKNGAWTLTNCRQRLNQFCQREHMSPDFKHDTTGPEHARIFICHLQINVKSLDQEFTAKERGSNKKQATAVCALSMVRQLFAAGLIEKFGDPIKHVTKGSLLGSKQHAVDSTGSTPVPSTVVGQKRKADDKEANDEDIDENGNWTVDNCRQRLNQFCQVHNIPCDVIYAEEGAPGSRTYTASLNLKVKQEDKLDEKNLKAVSTANTKKAAAQGCALQLLSQLYKLTLVEANSGGGVASGKKKPNKVRPLMESSPYPNYGFPSYGHSGFPMGPPMFGQNIMRRTPIQDVHLTEKHKMIYPSEYDLQKIQHTVRTIEVALKEVSEKLFEPIVMENVTIKPDPDAEMTKKPKLQGIMRVGSLAKGLLLRGETDVSLVLLCEDSPTAKLLAQVAQTLPKYFPTCGVEDNLSLETVTKDAVIIVQNTIIKTEEQPSLTVTVTIHLTSPVVRTPREEAAKDPPGSLAKDKCLNALAELRHAKWFQACANAIPSCVIVIRILMDIKRRDSKWDSLSDWAIELIVEKALRTSPVPISLGSSFLRVLECISSGILLPTGRGIADPCEREEVDVTANLTNQDRENVTEAAQNALRLFSYRQPEKVLGMDPLANQDWTSKRD